jgi:putative (di)nucleoside polyphosphate hydrolase
MNATRDPARFRPNVGLAVFSRDGGVLLGRRVGAPSDYAWQMPQGGIDRGESAVDAAFRELAEEIGVTAEHVDLLEETADWLYYEFPIEVRLKFGSRDHYLGQRQKWFAFRFKGRDEDVRLDTHTPEFSEWRWAPLANAAELVIPFKRPTYEEVVRRFSKYTNPIKNVGDSK